MIPARLTIHGDGRRAVSVVVLVAVLFTLVGRGAPAGAIETETFSLTPSPLVVNGFERRSFAFDPAEDAQLTEAVRVANKTDEPRRFRLYGADARREAGTDRLIVEPATSEPVGVGSWVTFDTTEIEVPPGGWEVVPFTITRPAGETAEGMGAVVVEELLADAEQEGVELVYRLALMIRLDGDVAGLRVGEPGMDPHVELFPSRSDLSVDLTNETLAPIRATVRLTAAGLTGRFWEVAEEEVRLAPGESTDVVATWTTVPRWGGFFEPTVEVVWERGGIVRAGPRAVHPPIWLVALAILVIGIRATHELRRGRTRPPRVRPPRSTRSMV